jgi:ATP-dependent DNA helicase RecG
MRERSDLNRHGGTVLLGVLDSGEIQGIEPESVTQICKDFITAINNPQKITPPTYLSVDEVTVGGKSLLRIFVPESSQVHRCNGRIYDRSEDGDLDITDHTAQVAHLYQRKQASYSENKVFPRIQVSDLRAELIEKCRNYVRINRNGHPWAEMDDLQLLKSAQLYQTDPETGRFGVTLAGVMLFGTDLLILQVCPAHRTDLILRKVNADRYDDRDLVRTNLIDSYDRILAFVRKHLPDPFYLEGIERRSLRDTIFREVASNLLIHREYASGVPARLIIEYRKVTTYNANRPHGFGVLNPETSTPFPKNPTLGAFFREIDRADELGSVMRKMMLYGKKYGGSDPQLIEGDVFRMIVSVPEFGDNQPEIQNIQQVAGQIMVHDVPPVEAPVELSITDKNILNTLSAEPLGLSALLKELGYSQRTGNFKKAIVKLLVSGLIELTIPEKPNSRLQKYRLTGTGKHLIMRRFS